MGHGVKRWPIAAAVALLVWYFGISPMYLIGASVAVGIVLAVSNGRKGAKQ